MPAEASAPGDVKPNLSDNLQALKALNPYCTKVLMTLVIFTY